MRPIIAAAWFCHFLVFCLTHISAHAQNNYFQYHKQISEAESLICDDKFKDALEIYEQVFRTYAFIFCRDYKVAAQVALYQNDKDRAFGYIQKGIAAGWEKKALRKNKFLKPLRDDPGWNFIEKAYDSLHAQYVSKMDQKTRAEVHKMFKKDQRKALGALLRIGDKARERYAIKVFEPHSAIQMAQLIQILDNFGYPGEQLIGNDFWMSTIISHHNSTTREYVQNDTIYGFIKPKLIQAIQAGQISPYEFALMDDWQIAVASDRKDPGYGFLNNPRQSTLTTTNKLRTSIGLRTIELRNKLVEVEKRTGINFYLPDWVQGEIIVQ
jgi:hypothetical protein